MDAPKRLGFRFSLRNVLLLTTCAACWLAWQAAVVRERSALLALVKRDGGLIFFHDASELPVLRRLMGDSAADWIMIPADTAPQYEARLHRAFPDAQITVLPKSSSEETKASLPVGSPG
jgi:hypothetical protein